MKKSVGKLASIALLAGATAGSTLAADAPETITVSSSAFDHHGTVPLENTAYGDGDSPQLTWTNLPEGTEELALIMDDPIAPTPEPFVHWVAYNIPASATGLMSGLPTDAEFLAEGLEGMTNGVNGIGRTGYFGPRPPADDKLHAYHFRVYALDEDLDLPAGLNKTQLLEAMEGHVLATGMLMGHYQQMEGQ
ncbi:MAG: YbhB/YbcL family Raf kinase inhibitor-like protein [Pseudohongiellaceae bacterium]